MMIGINDRQPIREDGKVLDFGTEAWTAAYRKRVTAIDEAFRKKGVPLIWVGLPITKNDDFADAMAALNEIDRTAAAQSGAIYVDTWEAFSDDNGDFDAFGPDVNGADRAVAGGRRHPVHAGGRPQAGAFRPRPTSAGRSTARPRRPRCRRRSPTSRRRRPARPRLPR